MQYEIISNGDIITVVRHVNERLNQGFECAGNMVVRDGVFYQPVLKNDVPDGMEDFVKSIKKSIEKVPAITDVYDMEAIISWMEARL